MNAAVTFPEVVLSEVGAIMVLGLVLLAAMVLTPVRNWMWRKLTEWITGGGLAGVSTMHKEVNEILQSLRTRFHADRCVIRQFHNGEVFLLSDHSWKVSVTHEIVARGVDYMMKANQNILVSGMNDFVHPIVTGTPDNISGVSRLNMCLEKEATCPMAKRGHWVMRYDVNSMDVTLGQWLYCQHGVAWMYAVNLVSRNKTTFGFLSLQFFELSDTDRAEVEAQICALCAAAERVQFLLTNKAPSRFRWWGGKRGG